jgi:hypothetical protein
MAIAVRTALSALGFSLALLSSGCALWQRPSLAALPAPSSAPAPVAAVEAPAPLPRLAPLPALSTEPEDFACGDGSQLRVSYPQGRDTIAVSLNGATPIAMRRADEGGLTAYRASNLVLRRSGVRVALVSDSASVTVQSGDTLGLIAQRIYGDRMRAFEIARMNNIENPDLILPGQVLSLAQMERRCRRSHVQEASYVSSRPLNRRAFSPPSARQPEQRNIRATATDPTR